MSNLWECPIYGGGFEAQKQANFFGRVYENYIHRICMYIIIYIRGKKVKFSEKSIFFADVRVHIYAHTKGYIYLFENLKNLEG